MFIRICYDIIYLDMLNRNLSNKLTILCNRLNYLVIISIFIIAIIRIKKNIFIDNILI